MFRRFPIPIPIVFSVFRSSEIFISPQKKDAEFDAEFLFRMIPKDAEFLYHRQTLSLTARSPIYQKNHFLYHRKSFVQIAKSFSRLFKFRNSLTLPSLWKSRKKDALTKANRRCSLSLSTAERFSRLFKFRKEIVPVQSHIQIQKRRKLLLLFYSPSSRTEETNSKND